MKRRAGQRKTDLKRFFRSDSGATAIEYGMIASGIFLVIIVAVGAIGPKLTAIFALVVTGL